MELYNIDVLADLNRERFAELMHEAEVNRLLHNKPQSKTNGSQPNGCVEQTSQPVGLLATVLALPGRIRLA